MLPQSYLISVYLLINIMVSRTFMIPTEGIIHLGPCIPSITLNVKVLFNSQLVGKGMCLQSKCLKFMAICLILKPEFLYRFTGLERMSSYSFFF